MSTIILSIVTIAACFMIAAGMADGMPLLNFIGSVLLAGCGYVLGKYGE